MYRILAFNFSKKFNKSGPTIQNIAHCFLALNLLVSVPDPGVQCHIKMESLGCGAYLFPAVQSARLWKTFYCVEVFASASAWHIQKCLTLRSHGTSKYGLNNFFFPKKGGFRKITTYCFHRFVWCCLYSCVFLTYSVTQKMFSSETYRSLRWYNTKTIER